MSSYSFHQGHGPDFWILGGISQEISEHANFPAESVHDHTADTDTNSNPKH